MPLITFPLLVLAAPVLVVIRGHFGRRIVWALLAALMVPLAIAFADTIIAVVTSPQHARIRTLLSKPLHDALMTHVGLSVMTAPFLLAHVVSLLLPEHRQALPRNAGHLGSFSCQPQTVPGLVVDWLRLLIVVIMLQPQVGIAAALLGTLMYPLLINLLSIGPATMIVCLVAAAHNGVLPGFAGSASRSFPLWRHVTRFGARSKARRAEPLAAILSRRPRDLQTIAGA